VDLADAAAAVPNITSCSVIRTGGCDRWWSLTVGWLPVVACRVAAAGGLKSDIADRLHAAWLWWCVKPMTGAGRTAWVAGYSYCGRHLPHWRV